MGTFERPGAGICFVPWTGKTGAAESDRGMKEDDVISFRDALCYMVEYFKR